MPFGEHVDDLVVLPAGGNDHFFVGVILVDILQDSRIVKLVDAEHHGLNGFFIEYVNGVFGRLREECNTITAFQEFLDFLDAAAVSYEQNLTAQAGGLWVKMDTKSGEVIQLLYQRCYVTGYQIVGRRQ